MAENQPEFNVKYEDKDYYILASDYQGTVRLALQDYIWREALGFSIHPRIAPLIPSKNAKIADVAAGTALWLRDVGRQLGPTAALDAFDIHLEQAPPKEWLPEQMNLHYWNIFEDPPERFHGQYDLVHVRLITVVIKNNDPKVIMRRFSKLLKPGGWLQWDEVDTFSSFVVKAKPDLHVPRMDEWCTWMGGEKRENQVTVATLWKNGAIPSLHASGFEDAVRHDHCEDFTSRENMALMRYNNDQLLMLSEQYARRVFADGNPMGAKLLNIYAGAAKDAEKGAVMIMPPLIWTAKKAG